MKLENVMNAPVVLNFQDPAKHGKFAGGKYHIIKQENNKLTIVPENLNEIKVIPTRNIRKMPDLSVVKPPQKVRYTKKNGDVSDRVVYFLGENDNNNLVVLEVNGTELKLKTFVKDNTLLVIE